MILWGPNELYEEILIIWNNLTWNLPFLIVGLGFFSQLVYAQVRGDECRWFRHHELGVRWLSVGGLWCLSTVFLFVHIFLVVFVC